MSPIRSFGALSVLSTPECSPSPTRTRDEKRTPSEENGGWLIRRKSLGPRTPSPGMSTRSSRRSMGGEEKGTNGFRAPSPTYINQKNTRSGAIYFRDSDMPPPAYVRTSSPNMHLAVPEQGLEFNYTSPCHRRQMSPRGIVASTPVRFQPMPRNEIAMWKQKIAEVVALRQLPQQDTPAKLLPFLYLGTHKHSKKTTMIEKMKATHIINCAKSQCPSTHSMYPSKRYLLLDAEDSPSYPLLAIMWEEAYNFIEDARRSGGCLFIHCQAGVNRSATLATAYCMVHNRWPLIKAIRHVFRQRPFILTNEFFQQQLILFAREHDLLG
uniref:protein-tyrosine-phosphatase n=1 Tax=Eutreptiella gymnastica TaxID=73025 RepID=A0A7S1J681_9EUGL